MGDNPVPWTGGIIGIRITPLKAEALCRAPDFDT